MLKEHPNRIDKKPLFFFFGFTADILRISIEDNFFTKNKVFTADQKGVPRGGNFLLVTKVR